jgi:hypothetical protein
MKKLFVHRNGRGAAPCGQYQNQINLDMLSTGKGSFCLPELSNHILGFPLCSTHLEY